MRQVVQPDRGFGIARGAPVAAGGKGAPRPHLGAVGQGRTLELAGAEEAVQKDSQPFLDDGQGVCVALRRRQGARPGAAGLVFPCGPGQKGHLARPVAEAQHIVQVEIMQLIGADDVFRALGGFFAGTGRVRHEFGGDGRGQDGLQDVVGRFGKLGAARARNRRQYPAARYVPSK